MLIIAPMRRLPPLAAVRVFEAAARHENFTAAAAELAMTQAAVSYQIKALETRLGVALFARARRRVTLTATGRRIAERLSTAFDQIDDAFAGARAESDRLLTISSAQAFAHAWLAARIGGFQLAWPDLGVRLRTANAVVDFAREDIDVGVRSGWGAWPGLRAEKLLPIAFAPMCAPALLAARGGPPDPDALRREPRLGADDPWWGLWFAAMGVDPPPPPAVGVRLDSQAHEAAAAMAGHGFAILTPFLWRKEIAEGRLICPFSPVAPAGYGYWLVYQEHRQAVLKIRRFGEWIRAELARDGAGG
ncbi:LysR substrate-binding domain-containing protein [Sphingomonas morindae]|uniref:LysR family transcriptional regulator n=1 Tax=Sphingomonas morindae TaxID=1541170 RepID=A0ABY4X377_9SPHN|nr:LysR substrate-binding domain-containing protein [Sphingomonas morindae]USI71378.1 LysR family transcriptional regulator [Sphingomonas morindae]